MAEKKAPARARKRARRKKNVIRYRQIVFKLTEGQKKALDSYCKMYNLTPVRFMKALINGHVARYKPGAPPPSYVTENQLELFAPESEEQGL
ncbi:MAG: hypothetical protein RG741_03645 [Bacteroidales bacterium]|nr:hypothetical protein [Bacteroidales bacterium]